MKPQKNFQGGYAIYYSEIFRRYIFVNIHKYIGQYYTLHYFKIFRMKTSP